MSQPIRIVLSGATGWAGSALARGIARQPDLQLAAAVGARSAGKTLREVLGEPLPGARIFTSAKEACGAGPADVYVEYAKAKGGADPVRTNILEALRCGAHVVVASSGLTDTDYEQIAAAATTAQRGVLACGNFALTAVLLQRFAEMAARYLPNFEIIDYASGAKPDAPSGTVRELTARLSRAATPVPEVPIDKVNGPAGVRGATVNGIQVHAVRLPGYVLGVEAVFGMKDQRLHLRHEAGGSAEPYVDGALLAIRKVGTLQGLRRGLDQVMDL